VEQRPYNVKIKRLIPITLLIVLAGVVICSGLSALNRTEYANGWDGYYYLVQLQSLHNTGSMHSPEYSPVYLPLIVLHAITGNYIASYRISAVMIKALFVFSVFTLALSLFRSKPAAHPHTGFYTALFAATLTAMSPSMNYYCTQFPKNLLGFALMFFFIASVYNLRWTEKRQILPSLKREMPERVSFIRMLRIPGILLLFLAVFFTHRFTAVLSLCFLALYYFRSIRVLFRQLLAGKKREPGGDCSSSRQNHRRKPLLLLLLVVSFIALLALSHMLPLALSIYDLGRISSNFTSRPNIVPVSFVQSFGIFKLSTAWIVEIVLASVLMPVTGAMLLSRNRFSFLRLGREYYILILIGLTGLFPFFRFSLTGLSYRLFYCTLLIFPLICVPYIRFGVDWILNPSRKEKALKSEAVAVLVFAVLLAASLFTGRSYNPELHDPPYEYYEELAGESMTALTGIDCELIIAHKALAHMIAYYYEVDVLPWAPEECFPRPRVWRITAGILQDEVAMYLGNQAAEQYFIPLSQDYALIREDYWEAFMQSIASDPVMLEAVSTWRNPLEQRPAYMTKENR